VERLEARLHTPPSRGTHRENPGQERARRATP
jgi:hypothetical protein